MNPNFISFGLKCENNVRKFNRIHKNINYSIIKSFHNVSCNKIRNIGILARVDAGKSTTTEKMLFLSDLNNHMGEFHRSGNTIKQAAVTFYWKKNQFNLIDTPGYVEFTTEVEQTLNVLDGAIILLDGSAGVEAETLAVWRQTERYQIPRIIFLNKIDRADASILLSCEMIKKKLRIPYLLLQLPVIEDDRFLGIIDILTMEFLTYGANSDIFLKKTQLTVDKHEKYFEDAKIARSILVDKLTIYDDILADKVIHLGSLDVIPTDDIVKSLRKVTKNQTAVPVLLGSSSNNFGIQSLMDAVIMYLPSPSERNYLFNAFEDNLCARAFKIVHNKQKEPLVFIRIYNGNIQKGQTIYSIKQNCAELVDKVYVSYANHFEEVESIGNGNIAIVAGINKVMSGDLVTTSNKVSQQAKNNILKKVKKDYLMDEEDIDKILGIGARSPEPVLFRVIQATNDRNQGSLEQALIELQREDPNLRVTHNNSQIIVAGIGEFQLEILKDRLLEQHKLDVDLGPLQIAFKETPLQKLTDTLNIEAASGNSKPFITVRLTIQPVDSPGDELLKLDKSREYESNIASIFPKHLVAVRQGIDIGLARGPKISCPVVNTEIILHFLVVGKGASDELISATVAKLIQSILKKVGTHILEPMMNLEIVTPDEYLSVILLDLTSKRAVLSNVIMRGNSKVIICKAPLSELRGYSTVIKTLSSGTATFTMELSEYIKMSPDMETIAVNNIRGL